MSRIFWWFVRIVILVIILYSLFFGSLLFLNPLKLGMRVKKAERSTVYTRNIYKLSPIYDFVDEYMKEAEVFYGLKYKGNVQIYVAETQTEFNTFMPPWVNGKNIAALTLPIGNTIYVNPEKIREGNIIEEELLKHELIHSLIANNSVILNNIIIENQRWVSGGMATYFGGPEYYSENEFRAIMKNRKLIYEEKSNTLFTNLDPNDTKFNDTVYKYFIKYLIEDYGSRNFKTFLNKYLDSPGNYKLIFFETYNKRFTIVVDAFLKKYEQ